MNDHLHNVNDDLLVKYLLGETRPEEVGAVEGWLAAAPANRRYFEHFQLIWEESKRASGQPVDEEAAWQKFRRRIRDHAPVHGAPAFHSPLRPAPASRHSRLYFLLLSPRIRVAASFLLILVSAFTGYLIFHLSAIHTLSLRSASGVTTVRLPDSSVAVLNKHSTLSYPEKFRGPARDLELQGEAFFIVAPDKNKPFTVHTAKNITITALGTSFNVRSTEESTEIIVETGLVRIADPYHTLLLAPHEKITLQNNNSTPLKTTDAGQLYKYYRTKEFVCDNTPLWRLVEALNETYNVQIVISRPSLRDLPISTTFRNESLDHILSVIRETFGISVSRTGDQILLQ